MYRPPVETKGIEPSFRRCDRRVLPLHYVPGMKQYYSIGRSSQVKHCSVAFPEITRGTSELPFFEVGDAIQRFAPVLFEAVGRIAEGHQFDNRYLVRDAEKRLDLVRVE
jgi:hypothetical protein